jgi:glycosyltransferase involved in cell wall biosynthesis
MRILYVSTWFPYPANNGAKIRSYHLLRALGARHEVSLLSFAFDMPQPVNRAALTAFCAKVEPVYCNPFQRQAARSVLRFLSTDPIVTQPLPEVTVAADRLYQQTTFDAVIASIEVTAAYALQAPASTVKVLEEHNSLTRWMRERYEQQTSLLQRLRCWVSWQKTRAYETKLFPRFDLCTMVSLQDQQESLNLLRGRSTPVAMIPNGVDCELNRPGSAATRPNTLIYNGAITYRANYDAVQYFLSEVYPRVRQQCPHTSLTITGSTEGVDRSGLVMDESVHFSGYVDDIRPVVGSHTICVAPLREGGGTRLKILEAMALGVPVVSTTKGAEGLDVVAGEHLLIADEPQTFAAAVIGLLINEELRGKLAVNARRRVAERYDWKNIGQQFVARVEDAVQRKRQ